MVNGITESTRTTINSVQVIFSSLLKSGCRIVDLAHATNAERLCRAIAINLVIAWRIMLMNLLGRETQELPVEALF